MLGESLKRKIFTWIITPLVVIVFLVGIGFTQKKADALLKESTGNELLYFPNDKLLIHFTAGMSNIVADLMWIQTIQYTASEFHHQNNKFTWLEHMTNTVTNLDPYFRDAYVNGGTFLASIGADDKAIPLLKKGVVNNPTSYEIPYELAKVYLLNRRNNPESPAVVSHYIRMAGERHKPEYRERFLKWANRIQLENDLTDEAYAIWEDVLLTSKDPFIRELAKANLASMVVHVNLKELNQLAETYKEETGSSPERLEDILVPEAITALNEQTDRGRYYLDDDGTVKNTLLQEDIKERLILGLHSTLVLFKQEHHRLPDTLDEFASWMESPLPEHPLPGESWEYDPITGTIS